MGDNIWLDDRNGVRTPMQWTAGANAGFSDASAGELYAPVIDDPEYGYQRVNVAAQRQVPDSMLNWMRHVVAIRQEHPCFGRGTFDLQESEFPGLLAYWREYEGERVLVLHNLTDATIHGFVLENRSVDLLSGKSFSPGALTLAPYQYLWLLQT
jgi:maltose alpha-D-glucosyltransferase/alpha-amylase